MSVDLPSVHHVDGPWTWLSKPAGVPVFPPHSNPTGPCVLRWLLQNRPESAQGFPDGFEGGIAHRLDVSTSGLLLVAQTPKALEAVRKSFSERLLTKSYLFLTHKSVPWTEHLVTTPIAHHKSKRQAMTVQRGRNTPHRGRWYSAETRFKQVEGPLWQAVITTGVTHQIRVHAASVGLALTGDSIYGGGRLNHGHAPAGAHFHLHHAHTAGPVANTPDLLVPRLDPPHWWNAQ